jgi:death-on-curing protein
MVRYILKAEVIHANRTVTVSYGQPHFVQQEANIDHILDGVERYGKGIGDENSQVIKKAAFLLHHLAHTGHVFADGNKRTAITATLFFLDLNGVDARFGSVEAQDELARVVKETAAGRHTVSYLSKWLKGKVLKL